ncbi:MAG: IspD/TarI family cytidylyltransferase [Clostridia bacterium]|nr:IspD/TarI family cytidylyltransferase [Clostridia bacterium]
MVIALITIGGIGTRFKSNVPKQFIQVDNKPISIYTLEKFQNNENIDKIIVACLKGYEEQVLAYKEEYHITKLEYIVQGGRTQPESISNCIDKLNGIVSDNDMIVVHAGNRPLVNNQVIDTGIELCGEKGNAVSYIECPEVVVTKDENRIIERTNLMRLQTPQIFHYGDIKKAYEYAKSIDFEGLSTTADLMIKMGKKLNFFKGSEYNIKITYREDLELFKNLINRE